MSSYWTTPIDTTDPLPNAHSIVFEAPVRPLPSPHIAARVSTHLIGVFALCFALTTRSELIDRPTLQVLPHDRNGWIRLHGTSETPAVWVLEASTNLQNWSSIARTHDGILALPDPGSANAPSRFYRARLLQRTDSDDWKNQIVFPTDSFLSPLLSSEDMRWVKFAIVLDEPNRVYFQDSSKYVFHFDFAVKRLQPFLQLSRTQFDALSLRLNGQRVVLGAVLFPPPSAGLECGIQFVGLDPYPKESIARWFALVQSTVAGPDGIQSFYLPTFEQTRAADADRAFFDSIGIRLSTMDRWLPGNQTYSQGWAIGRLKFFPPAEITQAFTDGRLRPTDILLTEGVPAEIPVLAGVVTLAPSTPNSHVAILARSFGIPFAHLANPPDQAKARTLIDHEVVLKAGRAEWDGRVEIFALNPSISPDLKAQLLALKQPPRLQIPRKEQLGSFVASVDGLTPADIKYFGGKAANFGLLRQSIPSNSPVAIAFSFDLWDAFLNQMLPDGQLLRTQIKNKLAGFSYPPPMTDLSRALAEVRKTITDTARFSSELQQVVTNALRSFEPGRNIRFRSSTNVEDSEQFTGAGLYDSFSGCLMDDLDGDTSGPSHCDPTEAKERGVFRAIQKVYASFYNDNAYLERLRHQVNEDEAGMGLLVHYSVPDAFELANGVATLRVLISPAATNYAAELVTQSGALSVSNPDTTARPEIVRADRFSTQTYLNLKQHSALVQLGASVLEWEKEYQQLIDLLYSATDRFRAYNPGKTNFTLDFEYKKVHPGVLSVKQIRQIPEPPDASQQPRYLLDTTNTFTVLQSEFGDAFSIHRLKSELVLRTRDLQLSDLNLNRSVMGQARITQIDGSTVRVLEGLLPAFPNATFTRTNSLLADSWAAPGDSRRYTLFTELPEQSTQSERVILTLQDATLRLRLDSPTPLPTLDFEGKPTNTTSHEVLLQPVFPSESNSAPVERFVRGENGLEVRTRFLWYRQRTGAIELKTAPLLRWEETRITGLISRPIILKGFYSQTYHPFHHNFVEEFIFEPRLEPGISASDLAELDAANVQLLYARTGQGQDMIQVLGHDGKFRSIPTTTPKDGAGKIP